MIAVVLLMFVGGIALAMAVSDPKQVTLRWLRLGGIIALPLLGVAGVTRAMGSTEIAPRLIVGFTVSVIAFVMHLVAVQSGWRKAQRGIVFVAMVAAVLTVGVGLSEFLARSVMQRDVQLQAALNMFPHSDVQVHDSYFSVPRVIFLPALGASGLLGASLMTMLLGHAYLTAGNEMTQAPFRRLVLMLGVLLLLRTVLSLAFGAWPYFHADNIRASQRLWNTILITARYLVGLVVPAVFTYMTYDCVQRRANQSATGILYVLCVLVIVGEGAALALMGGTGLVF